MFNEEVKRLFASALGVSGVVEFRNCRLSVVDETGETDLLAELSVENGAAAILIENKIDAAFQPLQPERYRVRAEAMALNETLHRAFCVLVAPGAYFRSKTSALNNFDALISYEALADAIRTEGTPRAFDRANLLARAVIEAKKAYAVVPNEEVGQLWQRIYRIADTEYPLLAMKSPGAKGSQSSWIIFKGDLPPKITVDWKVREGTVGLSFWKGAPYRPDHATDLSTLGTRARWRAAGTTVMIETDVPKPPSESWAAISDSDIRQALTSAIRLLEFFRRQNEL